MDLRHLRTFVSITEQGTVSNASVQLRITQPALSRQIRALEEELGVKLFDRVGRRLVLTSEGDQLLADCRAILVAVASLAERAQLFRQGGSGILRVAATPQMIEGVLTTFLHPYAEHRPNVQIELNEVIGPRILAMLEHGEVDVAVSLTYALKAGSHTFESIKLPSIEFLAVGPGSREIGKGGNVDINRLASYPLLLPETTFLVRTAFDAACRLAGFKPDIFMESRTLHTLLALAEAGHGVAIVPSILPTNRYQVRVARVTHRRKPLREPLAILWDKRRVLPPYAREFCELLAVHMRNPAVTLRSV